MIVKRLGLPIALLIVAILSIEVTLTVLRQRHIDVTFTAHSAALAQAEAQAAPESSTDDPVLILAPDGDLTVTVAWSYQIGPRFPTTVVRARVRTEQGETVAEESLSITCNNPLGCSGSQALPLRYGVRAQGDQETDWALGRYIVEVTRTYSGQEPVAISSRRLTVINP
ncbi:MAG: hypothetical protein CUN49_00490 [Candidatus Thermofonsia Clade 1 bacterium]|jgi:hypothetical protein|uniref:Uncharacterized protein n=1 Tax=Candidatus Thermofonsia Clade 1 bacterium TaxID=2364210 RepID=A0A2M8Q024_9CHLR|nr:MAG: hypothetical protein CUN49_00490 [Candidatus Thermofonsia Clade 1 bacterium]PJF43157.1 MAG: hypothetical protein CUN50_01055 [Candidatus Thermofonsia Clade 1 bacterium]RMF52045.1 MAG: hypothetical protein D6749_06065 [Chloroflexota bacterium]